MRMSDANGKTTPHVAGTKYHGPTCDDKPVTHLRDTYQRILGQLRYIADSTRPDIVFYVNKLAHATHEPTKRHWLIMKNLLRYLKETKHDGMFYRKARNRPYLCSVLQKTATEKTSRLSTYSDADFAGDSADRKSTTGAIHLYNKSPVAWTSTKQGIQALSTCEAEYIAATTAVQTTQCLRRILSEINLLPPAPTPLYVDNQAAIAIAKNTAPTRKRKFIELRHHFLRAHIRRGSIKIMHVPSRDMLADLLTKPSEKAKFVPLNKRIGIEPPPQHPTPDDFPRR